MIYAQHGTKRAPHIFFRVENDERYSVTLDKHFVHRTLRIGYNYNGPTEIGGLILLPEYRRNAEALGKTLSYVRFLFIRMHRAAVPRRGALGAAAAARARRHVEAVGGARPQVHRPDLPGGRSAVEGQQGVHPRAVPRRSDPHRAACPTTCARSSARSARRPRPSRRCCAGSASSTPSRSIRSTAARTSSRRPTRSRSCATRARSRCARSATPTASGRGRSLAVETPGASRSSARSARA